VVDGVLDTVYSDLMGPEEFTSAGGAKYIMNLVDNHSNMMWLYLLKEKSQVRETFTEWQALVENEMGRKVKCLHTDNGGEYTSNEFKRYLHKQGIKHQLTAPYTSAQNGCTECTHQTIMDWAQEIRLSLNLPTNMWGECVLTSAYVKNRTPIRTKADTTPFEAYHGQKPNLSHMQELGCQAFVLKQGNNPKICNQSVECMLIGYSPNSKAY